MCGITGILAFTDTGRQQLGQIRSALDCLQYRGPDGEGISTFETAALAHKRLAIIAPGSNASQPFTDQSGRYTLVFNGEIFNYQELRSRLTAQGCTFYTNSDTEVLLQIYIREKENCLDHLNGEFAFAVYDKTENELFIARDRFGIKPLFIFHSDDLFAFGSNASSILNFGIKKELDQDSLRLYLHLNYVPAPYSIYKGISKLQPGTWQRIGRRGTESGKYYTINPSYASENYDLCTGQLRDLLTHSVRTRMVADVPLGCFLSGGIDSSIVTAIAAREVASLPTFSIGYSDEPFFDETEFALLVSKKNRTEHTVFSLSNEDIFENLHSVLASMDEPFADSSALAVNILSRETRKHVKVALGGDGADEIFAGYNKHEAELRARSGGLMPLLAKASYPLWRLLPKSRNSMLGNRFRQLAKFSEGLNLSEGERYWRWAGFANEHLLLHHETPVYHERKAGLLAGVGKDFNSVLRTDVDLVLQSDMLVKSDTMSMSRGLEIRVPFLDHEVVNFAFSMPVAYKIDTSSRKKILKDAFRDDLPEQILQRGKKGFEVPLLTWFRTELRSRIEELLGDDLIRRQGIFDSAAVKALKDELFSNDPNDAPAKVYALIVFQHWWKKHFDA